MQEGPVDFELFAMVAGGIVTAGIAATGYVLRTGKEAVSAITKRVVALEGQVHANNQANIERHDNGLGDLWQALEAHRVETRAQANRQEERAFKFREASLQQLGKIEATLARLEARFAATVPHAGED